MKYKKQLEKLEKRQKDYETTVQRLGGNRAKGYRKPGSQKKSGY